MTRNFFFSNFLSFNAYADNADLNDSKNENVNELKAIQQIIYDDKATQAAEAPATNAYQLSVDYDSRDVPSTLDPDPNVKWGETSAGTYYCYKNPDSSGETRCMNCPDENNDGICDAKTGEQLGNNYIALPEVSVSSDGYITSVEPPVLFDQGGIGYEKYFYRYWNMEEDSTESGLDSSSQKVYNWSASLPQICFSGFNYNDFKNDVKDDASAAKNYFGFRKLSADSADEQNSYEKSEFKNRFTIHAEIKPETRELDNYTGLKSNEATETDLNVYAWDTTKNASCLDPEFSPYKLRNRNTDGKTYYIDNLDNLSSIDSFLETKEYRDNDQTQEKLPCGMFKEVSLPPGYTRSKGSLVCSGDNVLRERDADGVLYTRFEVRLPNGPNSLEDDATHYLNVRACVECRGLKAECKELVLAVLEDAGCTKSGAYACTTSQLETAIKNLRTKTSFKFGDEVSEDKRDIVYNKSLRCGDNCLTQVETYLLQALGLK